MKNFHYDFYIDRDGAKGMTPDELKCHLSGMYGIQASKKVAPRPKRRNDDIYELDTMLISATLVAILIGALMLIGWGCGL